MRLTKLLLINLFSIILLIGCSIKNDLVIRSPLPKIKNKFTPFIVWHHSIGNGSQGYHSQLSPVYDGDVIYAADRKGIIKAMRTHSGEVLWAINLLELVGLFSVNLSSLLSSGLTVSGNQLYIGTETGKVIAMNKLNGAVLWETDVAGEVLSCPVVSVNDNLVLIHTSNGVLQALDIHSGHNKWSIGLSNSIMSIRGKSTPAIAYGVAIVGSDKGRISIIRLDNGQIVWQQCISQICNTSEVNCLHDVNITPVFDVNLNIIYAIAYNGHLVSIDISSNQIIWKLNLGSVNDIIVINDIIYLVDQNDQILAIRKIDGIIIWIQDALLHRNLTSPVICNDYLVVGDCQGYLYWLDIKCGQFVAQNKIDDSGLSSRLVAINGKLFLQANNSTVYFIKP